MPPQPRETIIPTRLRFAPCSPPRFSAEAFKAHVAFLLGLTAYANGEAADALFAGPRPPVGPTSKGPGLAAGSSGKAINRCRRSSG